MTNPPPLIFLHGWSYDHRLWDAVRHDLGDGAGTVLDLGHFGPECLDFPEHRFIAVGHSFGGLWLLRHLPPQCAGLVLVNGFARFTAGADFAAGVPPRKIDRMITHLRTQPARVMAEFRARCGTETAPAAPPSIERLRRDLLALRNWDERQRVATLTCPILSLGGLADQVVSRTLTETSFARRHDLRTRWQETAGHLLPLTHARWCAAEILAFRAAGGVAA